MAICVPLGCNLTEAALLCKVIGEGALCIAVQAIELLTCEGVSLYCRYLQSLTYL